MTIRADSYSSPAEVVAYTKHLLDGNATFNSTTRPTVTEVEKFIDRASGTLNVALRGCGLAVPIVNSTAKLSCDDWVTNQATAYVELTQRGAHFDGTENTRAGSFLELNQDAQEFVDMMCLGFKRLGVTQSDQSSDGLQFTGLQVKSDRSDPTDSTKRQPVFERGEFDDKTTNRYADSTDDY